MTDKEIIKQIEEELENNCIDCDMYRRGCMKLKHQIDSCQKDELVNLLIEARKTIAAQRESIENFILGEREK